MDAERQHPGSAAAGVHDRTAPKVVGNFVPNLLLICNLNMRLSTT